MLIPSAEQTLIEQTFFPYASAQKQRVQLAGDRFVYYTTAATALQIPQRPHQIWMRSTKVMNDFTEVIAQALRLAMVDAGISEPHTMIVRTGIPLRANQR